MTEVLMVLIATALACGVLGPFIVLRRMSMTADALSHSVLFGIAASFFFVRSLDSIWLILGAASFGLLTVCITEILSGKGTLRRDDALGLVFPMFFSAGVIIITRFFRNAHLDVEIVLMGNPLFAPFLRLWGMPKAFVEMSLLFMLNLMAVILFYKPLKISSFDEEYARIQGIPAGAIHYGLMSLVSLTCVTAFNNVGSVLVISFFAAPAAAACLLSSGLAQTVIFTLIISVINCIAGYASAVYLNVSISGMCSFTAMLFVLFTVLFYKKGVLHNFIRRIFRRKRIREELMLIHLMKHSGDIEELGFDTLHMHLNWSRAETEKYINILLKREFIRADFCGKIYELTERGKNWINDK